jgi:hypothetical protein
MRLIDLITKEMLEPCMNEILKARMELDSTNFGGAMLERDLGAQLRKQGHWVYTQKQVETLYKEGVKFDLGCSLAEHKRNVANIRHEMYAADLLLFDKKNDEFVLVDGMSMKTSISDKDGDKIFIVNDAEGVIADRFSNDVVDYSVGRVMMVVMNTESSQYYVAYFDGNVGSLTSMFSDYAETDKCYDFHSKTLIGMKKKGDHQIMKIWKRRIVSSAKPTSFSRGMTIRREYLPLLCENGMFTCVCEGTAKFDLSQLIDSLLNP